MVTLRQIIGEVVTFRKSGKADFILVNGVTGLQPEEARLLGVDLIELMRREELIRSFHNRALSRPQTASRRNRLTVLLKEVPALQQVLVIDADGSFKLSPTLTNEETLHLFEIIDREFPLQPET